MLLRKEHRMGLLDFFRKKEQEAADAGQLTPLQRKSVKQGQQVLRDQLARRQLSREQREAYKNKFGVYPEQE